MPFVARWLPLIAIAVVLLGCGPSESAPPEPRARLTGNSPLVGLFMRVEGETGVPAELLATVAYVQSRLSVELPVGEDDPGHHHMPRAYGLMAIGSGGLTTLHEAAARAGLSETEVAISPEANVRAAALLLRDARQSDRGWDAALVRLGGDVLAEQVLRLLADGWRNTDDEGALVEVIGHGAREGIASVQLGLGYPGAIWNPAYSGNYTNANRGAAQINYVVIHTMQGSYAGAISWFKNPSSKVSAHYMVRSSDGEITQMVDDADIAWHDGCFNSQSIGIEHEGYVQDPGKWYTMKMYQESAKLTAWLCDKYGIPKDRQHIMGHGETPDCSDHTDPGAGWNWTLYMDLVKNGACKPTGCNGTKLVSSCGSGDCAAYGATCVHDGLGPRCVSVFCPPTGTAKVCVPNTSLIGDCNNGALSTGDCAVFGATCVDDAKGVRCASVLCPALGTTKVCLDDKQIMDCKDGAPSEPGDCSKFAAFCSTAGATSARCVSAFCVSSPDEVPSDKTVCLPNGQLGHCGADGSLTGEDCPDDKPCSQTDSGAACGLPASGTPAGGSAGASGSTPGGPGSGGFGSTPGQPGGWGGGDLGGASAAGPPGGDGDLEGSCACRAAGAPRGEKFSPWVVLFAVGLVRRRLRGRCSGS